MDWQQAIRRMLELLGVVERKDTAVRRRLAAINQSKKRGAVTVVLEDMGPRKISALTAVRKVTGLNLEDVMTLAELMLPVPILTNVDQETANLALELLEAMGAKARLAGGKKPAAARPEKEAKLESRNAAFAATAMPEPVKAEGEWVVVLQDASLLPERIVQILQRLVKWSAAEAVKAVADLPQPIFIGVDEEAALRAQRELQMYGAVVDVLTWDAFDAKNE